MRVQRLVRSGGQSAGSVRGRGQRRTWLRAAARRTLSRECGFYMLDVREESCDMSDTICDSLGGDVQIKETRSHLNDPGVR